MNHPDPAAGPAALAARWRGRRPGIAALRRPRPRTDAGTHGRRAGPVRRHDGL